MISFCCKICNETFPEDEFKSHPYKAHRISLKNYIKKHINKRDLLTGEQITFKSLSQYWFNDFEDKNNLKRWMKQQPPCIQKEYSLKLLKKRIEMKDLNYVPSHVELRTVQMPSVAFYQKLFDEDFNSLCKQLNQNIQERFDYNYDSMELMILDDHCTDTIIVDSREQKPFKLKTKIQVDKLDYGDYKKKQENIHSIRIERKSLPDLLGSLSKGFDRFDNELSRANHHKKHLVILVEEPFSHFISFPYLPHISSKIQASPEFLSHNLRTLIQKYPYIQFLFVKNRKEAATATEKILANSDFLYNKDLQYLYDLKMLLH